MCGVFQIDTFVLVSFNTAVAKNQSIITFWIHMTNNTLTVVIFYLFTLIKEKLSSLLLEIGRDETRLKEILMNSEN